MRIFKTKLDNNPGIPGCPKKIENEKDYLLEVENRARKRLDIKREDVSNMFGIPSRKMMFLSRRIMELISESRDFVRGHEKQLSDLAHSVFMDLYQDLIERYDIIVDIKIKNGKPQDIDVDNEPMSPPATREITDVDVIMEIHKRKLANLIMQGEAKNTKHILNLPETKEGLERIYGKERGKRAFEVFKEITEISDKMDWIIDLAIRQQMMEEDPDREHSAGNVKVDWVPKKEKLKLEKKDYDPNEEIEEDTDTNYYPKITARGVDFPMLLHESVKGLYEVLSLGGIPEDEELSKKVLSNTGRMDEPEDWRWGPEIASDFRDFINKNNKIDKYPNIREEFFKIMFDKETMSTEDFLELMRGILSNTDKARKRVDGLIDNVIENMDQYYGYLDNMERYEREMEEHNRYLGLVKSVEKGHIDEKPMNPEIVDYSKMSKSQLQSIIDDALDRGDLETLGKASVYL